MLVSQTLVSDWSLSKTWPRAVF